MTTQDAQAQQQTCGDGYPFPYTTAQGFAGERRCELQPGHDGYHLWQHCQWPPAQQQDAAAVDHIEVAKKHLAQCMDEPDWPTHNCRATCNDLSYLLAALDTAKAKYKGLYGAYREAEVDWDQLRAQLATARAERGEERRNASRLFDEMEDQNEAMRGVIEAARKFTGSVLFTHAMGCGYLAIARAENRCPCGARDLKAALARLDEQPGASQQTSPDAQ